MPHKYEEIAADLARRIDTGEFPPGQRLPGINALARQYGGGNGPAQEAIVLLELDGKVVSRPGSGTIVLDNADTRQRLDVGRQVRRNELGYLFGKPTGHWSPISPPTRDWVQCPAEVAELLDVAPDEQTLARHRVVGPSGRPMQITTTYIRGDLAKDTVLEQADTGPGGYLERLEQDMGYGPLSWTAEVSTRLPTSNEATKLGISSRLPVLVTYRVHRAADQTPLAVDIAVVDGLKFSYRFPLARSQSARWPTTPATGRNKPTT